jgi:ribonuclease Z
MRARCLAACALVAVGVADVGAQRSFPGGPPMPEGDSTVVITLGTGTPVPSPARDGPATAVVVGRRVFLFDAGPGVMRKVAAAGLPIDGVTAAFITHLHSDHTLGLPDLMFTTWVMGRRTPMRLAGPPGLRRMTDHFLAAWAEDTAIRVAGLERGQPGGYRVNVHELREGVAYDSGGTVYRSLYRKVIRNTQQHESESDSDNSASKRTPSVERTPRKTLWRLSRLPPRLLFF